MQKPSVQSLKNNQHSSTTQRSSTMPLSLATSALTTTVSVVINIYNNIKQDRKEDNEFLSYLDGLNKRIKTWELDEDNFQEEGQSAAKFGMHTLEIALEAAKSKLQSVNDKNEKGLTAEIKEVILGANNTGGVLNLLKDAEKLVYEGMVVDLHRNQQKQQSVIENLINAFTQLNLEQTTNKLDSTHDEYKNQLLAMREDYMQQQSAFFADFFQKQDDQLSLLKTIVDTAQQNKEQLETKQKELLQNREKLDNKLLVSKKLIDTEELSAELHALRAEYDTHIKDTYLDLGVTKNIGIYYEEAKNLEGFITKIQQAFNECENEINKLKEEQKNTKETSKKSEIQKSIAKLNGEKTNYSTVLEDAEIQRFLNIEKKLQKFLDRLNQLDQKNKKENTAFKNAAFFTNVKATAKRDMRVNTSQHVESNNPALTVTASKVEHSHFKSSGHMHFDMHQQVKSNDTDTQTVIGAQIQNSEFESEGDFVFDGSQHIT